MAPRRTPTPVGAQPAGAAAAPAPEAAPTPDAAPALTPLATPAPAPAAMPARRSRRPVTKVTKPLGAALPPQ